MQPHLVLPLGTKVLVRSDGRVGLVGSAPEAGEQSLFYAALKLWHSHVTSPEPRHHDAEQAVETATMLVRAMLPNGFEDLVET